MGSIPMAFRQIMARKRRRRFRAVKQVRAMARERVGAPPPAQVIEDKRRRRAGKHKKRLLQASEEAGE